MLKQEGLLRTQVGFFAATRYFAASLVHRRRCTMPRFCRPSQSSLPPKGDPHRKAPDHGIVLGCCRRIRSNWSSQSVGPFWGPPLESCEWYFSHCTAEQVHHHDPSCSESQLSAFSLETRLHQVLPNLIACRTVRMDRSAHQGKAVTVPEKSGEACSERVLA